MARERLSPEEAQQRIRDSKKRYQVAHAEELREKRRMSNTDELRTKRRETYRTTIATLVESGVLDKLSLGRKRLYTPEEAVEVAKRQRMESYARRKERIDAARVLLAQAQVQGN